ISEASGNAAVGGILQIGIAMDNDCCVATKFENNSLFPCAALDVPADGNAACEADELDALVDDQQPGVIVGKRENVESAVGPSGLLHAFCEKQGTKRRLRCRLQNHGAASGD